MEIKITKKQETINNVAKEILYTVSIHRSYGNDEIHWDKNDILFEFDREDITALAQRLSDEFIKV